MFGRDKKKTEPKRKHDLSQFGIFDVSTDVNLDDDGDMSGGDSDLEAELAAITSGGSHSRRKPKPQPVAPSDLDKMIAESLRDIASDEELSGDDNDPDLLDELSAITGDVIEPEPNVSGDMAAESMQNEINENPLPAPILPTTTIETSETIRTRIEMYKLAEKNAKTTGDSGRARRFNRGLKTLESLLKQTLAGKIINNDDIPPEVTVGTAQSKTTAEADVANVPVAELNETLSISPQPVTSPILPSPSSPDEPQTPIATAVNETKINTLLARQREYKLAALNANKSGEKSTALQYVKIIKMFDAVLTTARQGQEVDLSDMPPPPNELSLDLLKSVGQVVDPKKVENTVQTGTEEPPSERPEQLALSQPEPSKPNEELPPPPKNILEALTQRLEKYKSVEASAKEEGNGGKARRMGRIVKQYQDAIKLHKAGKSVPFDDLPTPPGFEPIPVNGPTLPKPVERPTQIPQSPLPSPASPSSSPEKTSASSARPQLKKQESRASGNHSITSVMNKTIEILLERQKEFKEAALEAKKSGEIEEAKEYLKTFKGIENLLDVARGGLPVDLSTLPISPKQRETLNNSVSSLSDEDNGNVSADLKNVYTRLEENLQNQLEKCKTWSLHHKALGDVAGKNRFDNLALSVQKDLDLIKFAHRKGKPVPKFHHEQKSFNIVMCNTDLAETELEINIIRGIGYNVSKPKDVDTYVKVDFPYPQETPYQAKTAIIYDTDSPEYNEKFVAEIQPKARLCQRVFKRHGVKFEVYTKGGFFRSDTLIGSATVKLQPLETACELHDSFDLMNGRKAAGGKLEVKIRIRNPILSKQVANETEKWLVIG